MNLCRKCGKGIGSTDLCARCAAFVMMMEALRGIVYSSDYGSPDTGDDNRPLMRAAREALAAGEAAN